MKLLKTATELNSWLQDQATSRIAFVPTMGALHAGHLSLVQKAQSLAPTTVVSIFVNPLQFGPLEDYSSYPRTLEADCALLEKAKVTAVFAPTASDFYGPHFNDANSNLSVSVCESKLSKRLCGAFRPGHFDGVCTVVLKLFNLIRPHYAVFGQKDAQQCAVIERMVENLSVPISIIRAPTLREPDGLAMSSRNRYLSPNERATACCIYEGLNAAKKHIESGMEPTAALEFAKQSIEPHLKIQYLEFVDSSSLEPITKAQLLPHALAQGLVVFAGYAGKTRLIDNVEVRFQAD